MIYHRANCHACHHSSNSERLLAKADAAGVPLHSWRGSPACRGRRTPSEPMRHEFFSCPKPCMGGVQTARPVIHQSGGLIAGRLNDLKSGGRSEPARSFAADALHIATPYSREFRDDDSTNRSLSAKESTKIGRRFGNDSQGGMGVSRHGSQCAMGDGLAYVVDGRQVRSPHWSRPQPLATRRKAGAATVDFERSVSLLWTDCSDDYFHHAARNRVQSCPDSPRWCSVGCRQVDPVHGSFLSRKVNDMASELTRRDLLGKAALGAASAAATLNARSYSRVLGAIMATRAYREGRKLYWDRRKEEIVDQPPA